MNVLLAARSEGSWVIALIFGAIWLIFSIVSAIAKQQEEAKRKRFRQQMEASVPKPIPVQQTRIAQRTGVKTQAPRQAAMQPMRVIQPQPARAPLQQKRQAAKRAPVARETPRSAPRTAPPPVPGGNPVVQSIVASLPASKQEISATEITSADAKKPRQLSVTAGPLNKWLRPATLRQQFMLTEVLQPPLALRPDRE